MTYRLRLYGIDTKALIGEWDVEADERAPEVWLDAIKERSAHMLWVEPDGDEEKRWPGEAVYGYGATRENPHAWLFGRIPWGDGQALITQHGGLGVEWERVA